MREDDTFPERVKAHFERNKMVYVGIGCAILGGLVAGLVIRSRMAAPVFNVPITNNNTPVFNVPITNGYGGYAHKIVQCLETGEIWPTAKAAAEAVGATPSVMSKVLNGHTDSFNGQHFKIIGLGAGL